MSPLLAQAPAWTPSRLPWGTLGASIAYDSARQRVVCFGGGQGLSTQAQLALVTGRMHEWDGTRWLERTPTTRPTNRWLAGMAYDEAQKQIVMFGGSTPQSLLDDTWIWDGVDWRRALPATIPAARNAHSMTYDAARQEVVMFGGLAGPASQMTAETWTWNGTNWTPRLPATLPPVRYCASITYDAARQQVVLFGGSTWYSSGIAFLSDTWTWDGANWTQQSPATSPAARAGCGLAYDTAQQSVVLFGGMGGTGGTYPVTSALNDTWDWNGTTWTQRQTTIPPGRQYFSMAYDGARQQVVVCRGQVFTPNTSVIATPFSDTWTLQGTTWSQAAAAANPPPRYFHAMASDPLRKAVVLVGGVDNQSLRLGDTWEWNGRAWADKQPAASPSPRSRMAMAYDAANQQTLLFGGYGVTNGLADTWLWDGTTWTSPTPVTSPSLRWNHAMASDTVRQRIVLFGGSTSVSPYTLNDTWEWDGNTWTQRSTLSGQPSARQGHAMAYDASRQATVMFGGTTTGGIANDTWEWNGTSWSQLLPTVRPAIRYAARLAYDPMRQRIVMSGGIGTAGKLNDAWEWDGVNWTQLASQPLARGFAGLDFDHARGMLLQFGGNVDGSGFIAIDDTWWFGNAAPATATSFGAGCPGSNGVPMLASNQPALGTAFAIDLVHGCPSTLCVFGLSFAQQSLPVGNCTLYLQGQVNHLAIANGAGFASLTALLPATPALQGTQFFAQGFALDGAAQLGVAATQALQLTVGD